MVVLSASDQIRLTALYSARDKLISGLAIAEVEYNGVRRSFAKADLNRLDREIDGLNAKTGVGGAYGHIRVRI